MNFFLGPYWIIYYLAYLIAAAILLWLYWDGLLYEDGNTRVFLLAAVFGAAAGTSVAFTMLLEGGVNIVLLIPRRIRQLKRQGRREQQERNREAMKRFGVEENGVVVLRFTPEVEEFLNADPEEPGKPGD